MLLVLDANEARALLAGRVSFLDAKRSMSACSASASDGGLSLLNESRGVTDKSRNSGKKGTSIVERTSRSSSPSICISCILALAMNLTKAKRQSKKLEVSQN